MQNQQYGGSSTIVQEILLNGNIPVVGRNGMMAGAGGVIPPALLDESRVPKFYHEAILACGATSSNTAPNTALVYNMMVTSGLPRTHLAHIWSTVNRTRPGQLTRAEFYSCLALIALAQKGESIAALSTLSQLPIPFLQASQIPVQQSSPAVVVPGQHPPPAFPPSRPTSSQKASSSASRFIPTSLLSRLRPEAKKEVDLIGDPISPEKKEQNMPNTAVSAQTTENSPSEENPSGPNYDLSDVDWDNVGTSFGDSGNSSSGVLSEMPSKVSPVPHCSVKLSNWEEAVRAAAKLFKECESTVGKPPESTLREVFETEKGTVYLRSLYAVNTIIGRIKRTGGNGLPRELAEEIRLCEKVWQKYAKFLREEIRQPGGNTVCPAPCPVCQDLINSDAVEFGTRTYHSTCANLWVNCVRPVLP